MTHEVIRAGALINKHRLVMISCALEGHVKAFLIDKHFTAFPSARLLVSVSVKGERKAEGLLKRSGSHPPLQTAAAAADTGRCIMFLNLEPQWAALYGI